MYSFSYLEPVCSLNTLQAKKGSVSAVVGEDRWLLKQADGYIEWGGVFCALQSLCMFEIFH